MEALGVVASIEAVAEGAFKIVSYINTVKEGGKQRLRLLTELNSLWMVLKLVQGNFEDEDADVDEIFLKSIHALNEEDGVFDQIGELLDAVTSKLQPKIGFRKTIQSLRWPFDKPAVDDLVAQSERLKNAVNLALTSANAAVIRQILNDTKSLVTTANTADSKMHLDWISSLNFLKQQNEFIRQVRQGTGEWFLQRDVFKDWTAEKGAILWCPGIPGAGKTFLASIVFEHLKQLHPEGSTAVVIAYCGYNEAKNQSIDNLVASIIKQLIQSQPESWENQQHSASKKLEQMYRDHNKKETFPALPELRNFYREEMSKCDRSFVIVDALDEIQEEPRRLELLEILSAEGINVLTTSRPLDNIADLFATDVVCDGCESKNVHVIYHCKQCEGYGFDLCGDCREKGMTCSEEGHYAIKRFLAFTIDIEATQSDVRNYVSWRVDHEARLLDCVTKRKTLRGEISETLVQQSNGMFLLAKLHMDALSTKRTPRAVQQTLQNLPTEISDTYERAMQRIEATNDDDRRMAMNFLLWIAFSARPLTVPEIEHATSILPGARGIDLDDIVNASDLTSLCAGLVIIDASGILRLVHFSAQNFLHENREKWFPDGNAIIADHCLTYLSFKEFENGPCMKREDFITRTKHFPLLDYVCTYWGMHTSKSKDPGLLTKKALRYLQSKTLLQSSVEALWQSDNPDVAGWDTKSQIDPLHLAAYCGLAQAVPVLIKDGSDVDCQDSMGSTPVMYAVLGGSFPVVECLLQHGANPNLLCKRGSSALHRAIAFDNLKIAEILLGQTGIDLSTPDKSRGEKTPLMLAASLRCAEILGLILQKPDLDVNMHTGSWKNTALTLAGATGDAQIVRQILNHPKINVNKRNKWNPALSEAATLGYFSVVEALLDHGADPEIQEGPNHASGTALNRAIDHGYNSIVRLLLQRGANAKVLDTYDRTIVHSAAVNGRTETLKVLFEANCGVNINAQGSNGRTALHDAAYFDYCSTIEILFQHGARTDILDNENRSPLGVARDQNRLDALQLLTMLRKCEEARDHLGGLPLRHPRSIPVDDSKAAFLSAAKLGHTKIVQSTLAYAQTDPAIDINAVDLDRHSALHYAIQGNNLDVLEALVAADGIDLNIQDRLERTPLHWTALHGRYKAAAILLSSSKVNVSIRDHFEETPLVASLHRGEQALATLLMEHGAWPPNESMQDALCAAAVGGGSGQLCEKLIRRGADPARKNVEGQAPYHLAEYAGNKEAASTILRLCEANEEASDAAKKR